MNNEELLKRIKELEQENTNLKEEMRIKEEEALVKIYELNEKLNKALLKLSAYQEKYKIERTKTFIPKTEKLENIVINEAEEIIKEEKRKTNKGKKYKKRNFDYEKYVKEVRYIEPKEEVCLECGQKLIKASEKVRYVVEVEPSKIKVIKIIKISKKCPKCNKETNKIYYPLSNEILGSSILTPSLASYIMYSKYELGIPFEHLAKHISNSLGFKITKQDLANYMAKTSNVLEVIYEKMKNDLLNNESKVIHSDETTLVVTKKDEENKNRKKSYVYCYTTSYYDKNQIRIYDFHESRSVDKTSKWMEGHDLIIICDDYSGYDKLKKENQRIKLQRCWAHVRRRYADIVKKLNEKAKKNSKSYLILKEIEKLFKLEKSYKEQKKTPDEIKILRQRDMRKIKDKIELLINKANPISGSSLEGAINYTKNCWNDLFTFFDDGKIEISNNTAERAIKPFVIQRKVFQTSGSYAGARYTAKLFSIIQTCLINNVNVEKYIEYVLNNIDKLPIEELLPYSNNAPRNK